MNLVLISALALFVAVVLCKPAAASTADRLMSVGYGSSDEKIRQNWLVGEVGLSGKAEPSGLSDFIDSVKAHVLSGGALTEAFGQYCKGLQISSTASLPSVSQLHAILEQCAQPHESEAQIMQVAMELDLACRLSESLGCEASRCLDAVSDSYRRMRLLDNQIDAALSVPKSTVKLLTALPIATLVVSELLGARSLSFLFGTVPGRICLLLGLLIYLVGMMWIRVLMKRVDASA